MAGQGEITMANYCPRLIEVALPIREVSFESARDKSIRHGHISTLHLWWARRPLPASRAVVFASLVPDPDHELCPPAFRAKVEELLSATVYKPYVNIPHTAEKDSLPDTPRNRLLMFIGMFSQAYVDHERKGTKAPAPKETLSAASLVKWESGVNEDIIKIACELLLAAHGGKMPSVLDPFSGGGAIPLEASRMGCETYANELNPVAHIIELCSLTYPRQYGKSVVMPKEEYEKIYGQTELSDLYRMDKTVTINNKLAHDVEYWTKWVINKAQKEIGHLYPKDDRGRTTVAYIWARTAICSNPTCRARIPLLRGLWLARTKSKQVAVKVTADENEKSVSYDVVSGDKIDFDPNIGPNQNRVIKCPVCDQQTGIEKIKEQSRNAHLKEELIAVVVESDQGKQYRNPTKEERNLLDSIELDDSKVPSEKMIAIPDLVSGRGWGITKYSDVFNLRQLKFLQTSITQSQFALDRIEKNGLDRAYVVSLGAYLGLWIDRLAMSMTTVGIWKPSGEFISTPFDKQAIPMTWDYPEVNPFSNSTGSAHNNLEWIIRYLNRESIGEPARCILGSATNISAIDAMSISCIVTDPPYYDAIGYADLSDFFYIWLKRSVGELYPKVFRTPLSPKSEEATSMKHRHENAQKAKEHFETLLTDSLQEARRLLNTEGVVSIMFAHQSTEAWAAFIQAILNAGLNITASWPIDTERGAKTGAVQGGSYLSSSVTVVCRKRESEGVGSFKKIRKELEEVVEDSLNRFWQFGFRGADLIVSSFGPAVGVFGKYETVEKADGSPVTVAELLNIVRELAFRNIVGGLQADTLTQAYVGWLNLYGVGEADYDDARQTVQMGTDVNIQDAVNRHIFEKSGNKVRLATLSDRAKIQKLGEQKNAPVIDRLHRAMLLWKQEKRPELVQYLSVSGASSDERIWKLAQALFETLPKGHQDWKIIQALLAERSTLVAAAKQADRDKGNQQSFNLT